MSEWIKAFLFGVIEGITEWLPISSTGHMILFNEFVRLDLSDAFTSMFIVVIQLGAILAVVLLFFTNMFPFDFGKKEWFKKDTFCMWLKIAVACIPAVVLELLFGKQIDKMFYHYQTVAIMLVVVGVLFLLIEKQNANKSVTIASINDITYTTAFFIGIFQMMAAIFPGTSRSGATIIGGLLLGMSRSVAAEFTFYLAVPIMFGASLVKVWKYGIHFTQIETEVLLIGMITAFVVSIIVIRFFMQYIKRHDFKPFGWYRIFLGVLVFVYL